MLFCRKTSARPAAYLYEVKGLHLCRHRLQYSGTRLQVQVSCGGDTSRGGGANIKGRGDVHPGEGQVMTTKHSGCLGRAAVYMSNQSSRGEGEALGFRALNVRQRPWSQCCHTLQSIHYTSVVIAALKAPTQV